jgi:hypothetical protein
MADSHFQFLSIGASIEVILGRYIPVAWKGERRKGNKDQDTDVDFLEVHWGLGLHLSIVTPEMLLEQMKVRPPLPVLLSI